MVYFDRIIKHYKMKKYKTTQVENSKPGLTESTDYEECTGPRGPGVTHPGIRPLWLFPIPASYHRGYCHPRSKLLPVRECLH